MYKSHWLNIKLQGQLRSINSGFVTTNNRVIMWLNMKVKISISVILSVLLELNFQVGLSSRFLLTINGGWKGLLGFGAGRD